MELIIILPLILVQSIFGIGLLLFGTPTLIYFGYNYSETLSLLLPISIIISLSQILTSKKKDLNFVKKFNKFCIPVLIISIFFILNFSHSINFNLFISCIMILVILITFFKSFFILKNYFLNFFLILIGLVHGLSNLGGSLLSILSVSISKNNIEISRFMIAYGYLSMAITQYTMLIILKKNIFEIRFIFYYLITIFIYFPAQYFFKKIESKKFNRFIYIFAMFYAFFILYESLIN